MDKWLINDIEWILKRIIDNPDAKERLPEYAEMIFALTKRGFGDVYLLDEFIEEVRCGGISNYDGFGEWIDLQGKSLGYINCNVEWLEDEKNRPEGARFIDWANK